MKKIYAFATLCLLTLAGSCNKFLDVVPNDGIATLDMAFNLRSTAERYLGTCYSYMPIEGNVIHDPAMLHHCHPMAQFLDDIHFMGDDDHSDAQFRIQTVQQA